MIALIRSFTLNPIACQLSYPLNSDIASPPGTFAAYLSCADAAHPHRTAIHTVANPIVKTLLRFITHLRTVVIDFFSHGLVPHHRRMTPHKRGRFHQTKVSSIPSSETAGHETVV